MSIGNKLAHSFPTLAATQSGKSYEKLLELPAKALSWTSGLMVDLPLERREQKCAN